MKAGGDLSVCRLGPGERFTPEGARMTRARIISRKAALAYGAVQRKISRCGTAKYIR